jgi:hypothetical protein
MKILLLSMNRDARIISHYYRSLIREVGKLASVDTIERMPDKLHGPFEADIVMGKKKVENMVDPDLANLYDFILVDSIASFIGERWKDIKTKRGCLINDLHRDSLKISTQAAVTRMMTNAFFSTYKRPFHRIYPHIDKGIVRWLPFSVDRRLFTIINDKDIGCLSVGRIQKKVYPIRWKINDELKDSGFYKRIPRPHETLSKEQKWPVDSDYVNLVSSSWLCASCTSIHGYTVLKTFEIPACNTVLYSDYIRDMGDLGFVPGKNMVEVKPDSIKQQVSSLLRGSKLADIAKEGHGLVHRNHTTKNRAHELITMIGDMV